MRLFCFLLLFTFITGFNTSEEDLDPSLDPIPHTDSDSDLVSSSLDTVTRLPLIFGFRSAPTPHTASVHQGGGYTRFRVVPQEVTHNGQEKAASVISDLAHTATHSLTDSRLSFTQKQQDSSLFKTQGISVHVPTAATSGHLNTGANTLPGKLPNVPTASSDVHDGTDTPSVHSDALDTLNSKSIHTDDITVISSAPTATRSYLSVLGNRATVPELQTSDSSRFYHITDGNDAAVMSSAFPANEERSKAHHSRETFRTNHLPHAEHLTLADSSVTGGCNVCGDFVSDLKVLESDSVAYVSDDAVMSSAHTDRTSQTNRLPRSTHVIKNVSNRTRSSLVDDASTVPHTPAAPISHRPVDTFTPSVPSEAENTTDQERTERYSYTPYYTSSPNTLFTPTESAATQASHTVHTEYATVPEQTSRTHTYTSPTQSDSRQSSDVLTTQDFISTTASTLVQREPTISTTLHTSVLISLTSTTTPAGPITAPYDTTSLKSVPVSGEETHNDNDSAKEVTAMFTITSDSNNHVTVFNTDSAVRLSTVTHHAPSSSSSSSSSSRNDSVTPAITPQSRPISPLTHTLDTVTTSTPLANLYINQTSRLKSTTPQADTRTPDPLTTNRNVATRRTVLANTQAETYTLLTPVNNPTFSRRTHTTKSGKEKSHRGRVFIVEDQPAVIKVETFQVLLQVILEEILPPNARLEEVELFLQNVAGYQSQHVTWHSGPVLQSMVTFRTAATVSWLHRAERLLHEAQLSPLPPLGVFVSGIRVKNITVGGLHSDVCSWLFSCPRDFSCISSEGNFTCRSVCHSEYCKNHGICVHRSGQNPVCQCPVGEDFWFMGQLCDLRMTRQRLAGVCFGVLAAIAVLMGLLSYLAVYRFKKMLIQAKAEQTQSSYRRFNHFDELSAHFWRRSWPGSRDTLDNTAFSRSDEILHMRALDRPCCYHDDTLSITSTYPDSVTHINTVYPHSSRYHWDMSMCSLADGVVDSGKASDLSVCSWPIEPIQWTPFPLLQQLRKTNTMKPSRPRSYCEGMELVGLEKSRTA